MVQQGPTGRNGVVLVLFSWIWCLVCPINGLSLQQLTTPIDRANFFSTVAAGALITWMQEKQLLGEASSLIIPLRFLPVGGCWALKIFVSSDERDEKYFAVVDTGSPFLTAPSSVSTVAQTTSYRTTKEQYGQKISEMNWQKIPYVTILTNSSIIDSENFVVAIEPRNNQSSQGSEIAFAGLVNIDDNRPTFLQQVSREKICAFTLSFAQNYLELSQKSVIDKADPTAFPLLNLGPYGPDLYHYALNCESLQIRWNNSVTESHSPIDLKRPVWLVLDTGLTGCAFSDSLLEELQDRDGKKDILPDAVSVSTLSQNQQSLVLSSNDQYWVFSSFRLPWFNDEQRHPHIIAMGCTFWTKCDSLTVDMESRKAQIILQLPTG